ncbi:hypothetical protein HZY62_03875 [Maribacter polysiphoniae]|uniref:Uncharacterized protein n=1 Tax=Maribacter polysiphoniae TaxID=429344 RepID=A0A316DYZ0_9FLAO|nr:hypothetical protein [Maribacter polysiphoniae]MBD1259713.1 hypothetical protein [Maribacter polysiphoniae]PWK23145.1 hypothetical protein LX92_02474 [Maribacter polysiphoniae]
MSTRLFYEHESDSRIMFKKDKKELEGWTESLEYINQELDFLIDIENLMLNDANLYTQLLAMRRENTLKSGAMYRYETAMRNAKECDDMACDAFYLNNHEKHRNLYLEHLRNYRALKGKVLSKILLNAKR